MPKRYYRSKKGEADKLQWEELFELGQEEEVIKHPEEERKEEREKKTRPVKLQ